MMCHHDPNSPTFIQMMDAHEKTLETLLASPDFKTFQLAYACHSSRWHYDHQTLRVDLLAGGTWRLHQEFQFSRGVCALVMGQVNNHLSMMAEIEEARSFYDVLETDAQEAARLAECLYVAQQSRIMQRTRSQFAYMRRSGWIN